MLEINVPDIEHHYAEEGDTRTAVMRARRRVVGPRHLGRRSTAAGAPGRPRRLWDELDRVRDHWLQHGALPLYGTPVKVIP